MPRTPLQLLAGWFERARAEGVAQPETVAFVTASPDGRPSARTVLLKRLEEDALVFTSALWTRKARELRANPNVSLLFYWPQAGLQVHVAGRAELAERELAVELFSMRDRAHQIQTIVSRQGEPIDNLQVLRDGHAHLMEAMEAPPQCPSDWGAIRVVPEAVEFWEQAPDRMHERALYERVEGGWSVSLLAP